MIFMVIFVQAFGAAAKNKQPPVSRALPGVAPYVVRNDTGLTITVCANDSLMVRHHRKCYASFLTNSVEHAVSRR